MGYKKKVDANQKEIVAALRKIGCSVEHLHTVGAGVPDILVGYQGRNILIEIKDGNKPPSQQKLNDKQVEWHSLWRGEVYVINSADSAIKLIKEIY